MKGVVAAGVEVMRVEVNMNGKIVVVAGKPSTNASGAVEESNEWDRIQ